MTPIPREELEVFRSLKDIKVVIDVGPRTDMDMYNLRPDLEYHLFEAHTPFFDELPDAPNVNKYNVALSDKTEVRLYDIGTQSFNNSRTGPYIEYPTKRLDDFNIKADFIKIDAEGLDYSILLGAPETIKHAKYIQFEYWDGVKKFVDLLQGFEFYLMMEPELRKVSSIKETLTPLNVDFVDNFLIKQGAGGNILAIRK
jgi:FkbM family methyltransferase